MQLRAESVKNQRDSAPGQLHAVPKATLDDD